MDERVKIVGQGEDQMKIAGGQQLASAGIEPAFLGQRAAFGTVTVAAAVVGIAFKAALVALLPVTAHHGGPATADMMHGLQVIERQAVPRCISIEMAFENMGDFDGWPTGYAAVRRSHGEDFLLRLDPTD